MTVRNVRRLVTGQDENGKSCFLFDGNATSILQIDEMGGLTLMDLWETETSPADNFGAADNAERPVHLEPQPTGTIFRVVDFPPDSVWKDDGDSAAAFAAMGGGHTLEASDGNSTMHKTNTVDYALVLEGEIWAIMDTDERMMQAGDALIQRGTNHAWANKTDRTCRMMFVLCGADPIS